jgi:hypothetical protein
VNFQIQNSVIFQIWNLKFWFKFVFFYFKFKYFDLITHINFFTTHNSFFFTALAKSIQRAARRRLPVPELSTTQVVCPVPALRVKLDAPVQVRSLTPLLLHVSTSAGGKAAPDAHGCRRPTGPGLMSTSCPGLLLPVKHRLLLPTECHRPGLLLSFKRRHPSLLLPVHQAPACCSPYAFSFFDFVGDSRSVRQLFFI